MYLPLSVWWRKLLYAWRGAAHKLCILSGQLSQLSMPLLMRPIGDIDCHSSHTLAHRARVRLDPKSPCWPSQPAPRWPYEHGYKYNAMEYRWPKDRWVVVSTVTMQRMVICHHLCFQRNTRFSGLVFGPDFKNNQAVSFLCVQVFSLYFKLFLKVYWVWVKNHQMDPDT